MFYHPQEMLLHSFAALATSIPNVTTKRDINQYLMIRLEGTDRRDRLEKNTYLHEAREVTLGRVRTL
jgi:hypothetical protein